MSVAVASHGLFRIALHDCEVVLNWRWPALDSKMVHTRINQYGVMMALTKCDECGGNVSDRAAACPHCGNPTKAQTIEKTGKRYKAAIVLAWLIVLVAAPTVGFAIGPLWAVAVAGIGICLGAFSELGSWWNNG